MAKVIDKERCPRCGSFTLVTLEGECADGRWRYCSFVECSWGIDEDVPYQSARTVDA